MELTSACMRCLLDRREEQLHKFSDEEKKADYFREILGIISREGKVESAPYLSVEMKKVYERYFGEKEDFSEIKRFYNELMLSMEAEFEKRIRESGDPVRTALCFAQTANYIDFGTGNEIKKETLLELFDGADPAEIDEKEYENFSHEMEGAKMVVLLADNCGEIVLDKLLLKILKEKYPKASYTLMVRGMPVSNDVTREDALQVRVQEVTDIMDNGTDIGGTAPNHVPQQVSDFLSSADVIIAKGQGNFETAYGFGWPIYYLFLCKCDLFMRRFGKKKFGGMFVHESRVKDACLM